MFGYYAYTCISHSQSKICPWQISRIVVPQSHYIDMHYSRNNTTAWRPWTIYMYRGMLLPCQCLLPIQIYYDQVGPLGTSGLVIWLPPSKIAKATSVPHVASLCLLLLTFNKEEATLPRDSYQSNNTPRRNHLYLSYYNTK